MAVTNVIHTKSGRRRMVSPGARRVTTVAMRLMAPLTDPMPSTSSETIQKSVPPLEVYGVSLSGA